MKKPVNLTLHERVLEFAQQVMQLRGQSSLSAFVEELIRDEYERRHGPMHLSDSPATPSAAQRVADAAAKREAEKVVYPPHKRARRAR